MLTLGKLSQENCPNQSQSRLLCWKKQNKQTKPHSINYILNHVDYFIIKEDTLHKVGVTIDNLR